jgi:hypothetical protein
MPLTWCKKLPSGNHQEFKIIVWLYDSQEISYQHTANTPVLLYCHV